MSWIARPTLEDRLENALQPPGPGLVVVHGPRRSGVSGLVRTVLGRLPAGDSPPPRRVACAGTVGPGHRSRRVLADALESEGLPLPGASDGLAPSWSSCFEALLDETDRDRRPSVVVLDEAHHLLAANPDLPAALGGLWLGARSRGLPLHLVLATTDRPALHPLLDGDGPLAAAGPREVEVGPVGIGDLRAHLPSWSPRDRFLLRAALGGSPATLGLVDPDLRPSTNLQRLVLDPSGPLHDDVPRRLAQQLQKPERYAGILAALADGATDWKEIREANPAFPAGNQLAPYVSTLQELGWLTAERSLDATPGSRRRRYVTTDPFTSFWYHAVEPAAALLVAGASPARIWRTRVRSALLAHAARAFPRVLLDALEERGEAALPVGPRRLGGLWGEGYDLPVAGTLRNGAALYGVCVWDRRATVADADDLTRQMRATRYGFGREGRLRVIFTSAGATEALLRRSARDELLLLVPLDTLF